MSIIDTKEQLRSALSRLEGSVESFLLNLSSCTSERNALKKQDECIGAHQKAMTIDKKHEMNGIKYKLEIGTETLREVGALIADFRRRLDQQIGKSKQQNGNGSHEYRESNTKNSHN